MLVLPAVFKPYRLVCGFVVHETGALYNFPKLLKEKSTRLACMQTHYKETIGLRTG